MYTQIQQTSRRVVVPFLFITDIAPPPPHTHTQCKCNLHDMYTLIKAWGVGVSGYHSRVVTSYMYTDIINKLPYPDFAACSCGPAPCCSTGIIGEKVLYELAKQQRRKRLFTMTTITYVHPHFSIQNKVLFLLAMYCLASVRCNL